MQTILAYVATGLGVSLVPQSLSVFHRESIIYLPLRGSRVKVELSILHRNDGANKPLGEFCGMASEVGMEFGRLSAGRDGGN